LSELENLINELPDEDIEYLEKSVFKDDGNVISLEELDKIIKEESTAESQADAVQFALKINLNSVDVCAAA